MGTNTVSILHIYTSTSAFCNVCIGLSSDLSTAGHGCLEGRSVLVRTRLREIMHDEEEEEYSIYNTE